MIGLRCGQYTSNGVWNGQIYIYLELLDFILSLKDTEMMSKESFDYKSYNSFENWIERLAHDRLCILSANLVKANFSFLL